MQNGNNDINKPEENALRQAPPELELPFQRKQQDAAEWVYDNRASVMITVIIYLVIAIVFVSSKIMLRKPEVQQALVVEIAEMEKTAAELAAIQALQARQDNAGGDNVRNLISDENSTLEKSVRGNASDDLIDDLNEVEERIRQNREMYEEGIRQNQEMIEQWERDRSKDAERADAKIEGNVTVAYSLKQPIRPAAYLQVPAYQCRGGGRVVVDIVVNRKGQVSSAAINKALSGTMDNCMTSAALSAAQNSRFRAIASAPAKHSGTITYTFVPQ